MRPAARRHVRAAHRRQPAISHRAHRRHRRRPTSRPRSTFLDEVTGDLPEQLPAQAQALAIEYRRLIGALTGESGERPAGAQPYHDDADPAVLSARDRGAAVASATTRTCSRTTRRPRGCCTCSGYCGARWCCYGAPAASPCPPPSCGSYCGPTELDDRLGPWRRAARRTGGHVRPAEVVGNRERDEQAVAEHRDERLEEPQPVHVHGQRQVVDAGPGPAAIVVAVTAHRPPDQIGQRGARKRADRESQPRRTARARGAASARTTPRPPRRRPTAIAMIM